MLTPKGSAALRLPCINWNNSLKVRVPSPLLSYFANMSSNCCGRKRPSLSYVSLSDPCYTCSRNLVSPGPVHFCLLSPQRDEKEGEKPL